MKNEIKRMTLDEWESEAISRFGEDCTNWVFVCPNCGHPQTAKDFEAAGIAGKDVGKYLGFSCIGRFLPDCKGELGNKIAPCNYTNGGLFNIAPVVVMVGEHEHYQFSFGEAPHD